MIISARIWEELGPLSAVVAMVNHNDGIITFSPNATAEDKAAVDAILAAHNPLVPSSAEVQAAQDRADAAELKADTKFQNLIGKTPQQCINWAENNFPTLTRAEQRDIGTLVQAIGILARRL